MKIKIRATNGHVLIDPILDEPVTTLFVPESSKNREMPQQGFVVSVGGRKITKKGVVVEHDFKIGDKVLFRKFSGLWMEVEGKKLIHIGLGDIEAVLG